MEVITLFWDLREMFPYPYKNYARMEANNEKSLHIIKKLEALEKLVHSHQKKTPDQISEDVKEALDKLNKTVISGTELMTKYEESFTVILLVKANHYKAEFEKLNKRLIEASVTLCDALHVHQDGKQKEQQNMNAEQRARRKRVDYWFLFFVAFLTMCSHFPYKMFNSMKTNNQQFPDILKKLEDMGKQVHFHQNKTPDQISEDVKEALDKSNKTVISGTALMKGYNESYMLIQLLKANDYKAEFEKLNKRLTEASVTLSGALHVHHGEKPKEQGDASTSYFRSFLNVFIIIIILIILGCFQDLKTNNQKLTRQLKKQQNTIAEQEARLKRMESKSAKSCILQ